MKFLTLAAALSALVSVALGGDLTVNTPPSVTVCEPTQLAWSGGTGPYYLSIIPGSQPGSTPFESLGQQNGTSYTWLVNLEQGTSINIEVKDSTGAVQYSSIITIQGGSSTSCLNSSSQPSGTASSGASPTSIGSGTTGGSTTTASSGSGSSTSTSSGSSPSSTSTNSNGAGRLGVSTTFSVAGIMGLVGAALF